AVESIEVDRAGVRGVAVKRSGGDVELIESRAVVVTTGTFMRGLMHTGESKTPGGRDGEAPSTGIAASLRTLGFELGRLKTGTPPRVHRESLDWAALDVQEGDARPSPFSELTERSAFPVIEQVACRQTRTTEAIHGLIRENLHRAPMFSGQIESQGPRYCPSIEDKVVRFADRESHGVFLEPESHRDDIVYCNGIATSLPTDVQEAIVRGMPGCEHARIAKFGYAVEYDMVRPHQILATCMTKSVEGLFFAGQINGTSGYEEAAAQGTVAGINAARHVGGLGEFVLGRHEAYIGVLMDDLVTKTPTEPYRMFTSRAEHRLLLRADNAADRLTPIAIETGLLSSTEQGARRERLFEQRRASLEAIGGAIDATRIAGRPLAEVVLTQGFDADRLRECLPDIEADERVWLTAFADRSYEPYLRRQRAEIRRQAKMESRRLPIGLGELDLSAMRAEAQDALRRFTPATFGQAGRLEGITPADLTLLAVLLDRRRSTHSV
ncbi:MAG: FAD-dependent oxidoreductase, partial [Planctomycetota bacterium]